jgi:hypothetical protein
MDACRKGIAMDCETESLSKLQEKLRLRQQHASAARPSTQSMTPQIKMFVSGTLTNSAIKHGSLKPTTKGRQTAKAFAALFSMRMLAK